MENNITKMETRVFNLEGFTQKLAMANKITNEVVNELAIAVGEQVRNQVKEEVSTVSCEIENKIMSNIGETINDTVRIAVNERGLNRHEIKQLTNARNYRLRQILGEPSSDKYVLYISFIQGAMMKGYRNTFDVNAYGDVDATRFKEAVDYFNNFVIDTGYFNWATQKLHDQYRDGEIENKKKLNAYERFFGIRGVA